MIKNIEINGFKSFVSEVIDLNQLTVLTGLNSSGKSSVIQSLLILENIARRKSDFLLNGHGNFDELENPHTKDGINLSAETENGHIELIKNEPVFPADTVIFPEIIYISASRYGSETSIPVIASSKRLGNRGENVLNCIDAVADELLDPLLRHPKSEGDTFMFNLRAWLQVISPNVKFDYKIHKMSDSSYSQFNEHRATNVGFGLSYTLPVITALLLGTITPNSLVVVENPEAHLHPKGQTEMARLISLCACAGAQIVIETHSDHLFDGIRIYAKQNPGFAKKVSFYWFELNRDNNTETTEIEIDDNGRIKSDCPPGFFDQFELNATELL